MQEAARTAQHSTQARVLLRGVRNNKRTHWRQTCAHSALTALDESGSASSFVLLVAVVFVRGRCHTHHSAMADQRMAARAAFSCRVIHSVGAGLEWRAGGQRRRLDGNVVASKYIGTMV